MGCSLKAAARKYKNTEVKMTLSTPDPKPTNYPLLPLRDVVVYPHMVVPLFVGREKSIDALESAMEGEKTIILVAQRDHLEDDPGIADIYEVGTLATILQMLKLPDGTLKVLVEGLDRVRIDAAFRMKHLCGRLPENSTARVC
tara:strand:- start:2202 stop:2630 length:429 start_codon:yes stop_codon:yes gene_type:complete